MEVVDENILIVGGGIAGLTTSLALHRVGIRSIVLESSESLRVTGFALTTWTNAWRALDVLGVGDSLRQQHLRLQRMVVTSTVSGQPSLEKVLDASQTGPCSSKVVSIEDSGHFKLVHLADGTIFKTKLLIGCDRVNSAVAKWLGFNKPAFVGRSSIRGYVDLKSNHGFGSKFWMFVGKGVRSGFIPCDDHIMYWFFTWSPSKKDEKQEDNPSNLKQFVLAKNQDFPNEMKVIIESTPLDNIVSSRLRFRYPWEVLWGNISKNNVCVAGDALHPMTPDLGQGGCSALEDGIILARCISEALTTNKTHKKGTKERNHEEEDEFKKIEMGLSNFAKERRWRSFGLISLAYVVGFVQQSNWKVLNFLRDRVLFGFLAGLMTKNSDFDCGKLDKSV